MVTKLLFNATLIAAWLGLATNHALAQSNTERGAVKGGAAGAIIGGIIGHQNDETPEGILIGGAVGALAGGLLGNEHDQQIRRDYHYSQQQAAAFRNGVSLNDVVALSSNGVGSEVIINQIQMKGVQQRIGVNEIIALHQQGVDNRVIDAMQHAPSAGSVAARPPATRVHQYPVVVEPVVVPHVVRVPYSHHHHHHHRYHRYHRPYGHGYGQGASFHFRYRR